LSPLFCVLEGDGERREKVRHRSFCEITKSGLHKVSGLCLASWCTDDVLRYCRYVIHSRSLRTSSYIPFLIGSIRISLSTREISRIRVSAEVSFRISVYLMMDSRHPTYDS
jgi:hypothetical protein